ncbi:MAG: hypothetical protein U5L96_00440 [Owenweeksia sp.]|nr:hypothetical protein [Owenweeksia sp.]
MKAETRDYCRQFDLLYNIEWPWVHLRTAAHYLDTKGQTKAAAGGSEWKKYLHPNINNESSPGLWTQNEKANWAVK